MVGPTDVILVAVVAICATKQARSNMVSFDTVGSRVET